MISTLNGTPLGEERIRGLIAGFERYLRDPTLECEIRRERGTRKRPADPTGFTRPTDGETVTIVLKINGGATGTNDNLL